ncbi:MAG: hypothetical protein COS89_06170 [Deltaproteobacteria bacterium CG07_land_8_20_14_0_80_38_7]|nr:MAG: hypothetical protein COS89_06170 [Deltaproteobacteria bacterium CG07_land_8_20_14_0_80_38_7]
MTKNIISFKKIIPSIIVLLFIISSCQKEHVNTTIDIPQSRSAIKLQSALKKRSDVIKTLKGFAFVEMVENNETRKTDIALIIQRPNNIRIDAIDSLADVWASIGCTEKELWLWFPLKKKLYTGKTKKKNLKKVFNFDWNIDELISILSGLPPYLNNNLIEIDKKEGHYKIKDKPIHIYTDKSADHIVKIIRYNDDNSDANNTQYTVTYSDWTTYNNISLPQSIEADFPSKNSYFSIGYLDVEFNKDIENTLFNPKTKWLDKSVNVDH